MLLANRGGNSSFERVTGIMLISNLTSFGLQERRLGRSHLLLRGIPRLPVEGLSRRRRFIGRLRQYKPGGVGSGARGGPTKGVSAVEMQ